MDIRGYQRIALIADTHGPIHSGLISKLLKFDCIIHAGDIGGFSSLLGEHGLNWPPVFAVRGNNDMPDKWPPGEIAQLQSVPETLTFSCLGGQLAVIHGHQFAVVKTRHEKLRAQFPNAKAVVYGHSHRPIIDKCRTPWMVNPGAAGRTRAYGGAGFIGLTVSEAGWRTKRIVCE